ncbi:MAG: efflux RND transporter permease subunit [Syntrophobacterales bacterium]|nr:MAG: efflux RND transporter permease subunit [Syntrophobacterales bacterium]
MVRYFVRNSVFVNLLMMVILVAGILIYLSITREMFPEFSLDSISVRTGYPGSSPQEVEKLITIKIEEEIADIEDVDNIYSESQEGLSLITVELSEYADLNRALNDISSAIDRIEDLPEDVDDPVVSEIKNAIPIITVSIFGDLPELTMKEIAEDIRDNLREIPGVGSIYLSGAREREIWVEVDPRRLEQYQLSIEDIKNALQAQNLNLPGGTIKTDRGEFLLRTVGEILEARGLESVILRSDPQGNAITLAQVARVRDHFEDPVTLGRFNGQPAINLAVGKEKRGDVISISRAVQQFVAQYEKHLPPGVSLGVFNDFSVYIKNRLNTLKRNGMIGFAFVLIILCIFFNFRVAGMTALGIPVSFAGALILMQAFGISLNMISMFGLILVLGIIVDDAIVVSENTYRHIEQGLPPQEAAILGTQQVLAPVVATVVTTIAAFLPMLLVAGTTGKFMSAIPKVVSFALLASLMEALVILPSHLAEWSPKKHRKSTAHRSERWFSALRGYYARFLAFSLQWKYVSLGASLGITAIVVTFALTRIPFILFHEFESTQFFINVETPVTSKIENTRDVIARIEKTIMETLPPMELTSVASNVGLIFLDINRVVVGSNGGQIMVELTEADKRNRSSQEIINELRKRTEGIPGATKIQYFKPQGGPGGAAIEIRVVGDEIAILQEIAKKVKGFLATIPATKDIRDDFIPGKKELRIVARPEARSLGLDVASIARQVRSSFYGAESSKILRSDGDIPIVVKYPKGFRDRPSRVEDLVLTTPSGEKVYFSEVAELKEAPGNTRIIRSDQKRSITVLADVDEKEGNTLKITNEVRMAFDNLQVQYPGYKLEFKGERQELEKSIQDLLKSFLIAVLLIYLILGALFKSYIQPLVVMLAIPFAATGVVLGHAVMGLSMGILSLMGMVALAGVVVNDSLILVNFVNQLRHEGTPLLQALMRSGQIRLRPILLTTITTVAGLTPLGFFASGQAKFLAPMAISIIFGLTVSTVLTLIIIPCSYAIVEEFRQAIRGFFGLHEDAFMKEISEEKKNTAG